MTYLATACQLEMRSCFDPQGGFAPARLEWNLAHTEEFLRSLAMQADSRLYVLPEFSFQGWAMGRSVEDWNSASVRIPGPETQRIGALARELDAYKGIVQPDEGGVAANLNDTARPPTVVLSEMASCGMSK